MLLSGHSLWSPFATPHAEIDSGPELLDSVMVGARSVVLIGSGKTPEWLPVRLWTNLRPDGDFPIESGEPKSSGLGASGGLGDTEVSGEGEIEDSCEIDAEDSARGVAIGAVTAGHNDEGDVGVLVFFTAFVRAAFALSFRALKMWSRTAGISDAQYH
ncbi:MAG: hypothetical protein LQ348_003069 [Seirophora lacunosa]|nr:MAG: hypothetical protein LQ348_003069 [Seirophora lacunosa]